MHGQSCLSAWTYKTQIVTVSRRFSSLRMYSMAKNKDKTNQSAAKEWREKPEPLLAVPEDER